MSKEKEQAYKIKRETSDELVLVKKTKYKDNNFVKLSIVIDDRQAYMNRVKETTRQGQMILSYLYFDIDYNIDTIQLDREAIKDELGMSDSMVKRGISNLIKVGYIIKTKVRSEYLINSDLFFKGIRTPQQKETANNTFNTYVDKRTINITVMNEEAKQDLLKQGFGIKEKYIDISPSISKGENNR